MRHRMMVAPHHFSDASTLLGAVRSTLIKKAYPQKKVITNVITFFVELEGIEPSSKRGNNVLSTCLSLPSFSSRNKTRATNYELIF